MMQYQLILFARLYLRAPKARYRPELLYIGKSSHLSPCVALEPKVQELKVKTLSLIESLQDLMSLFLVTGYYLYRLPFWLKVEILFCFGLTFSLFVGCLHHSAFLSSAALGAECGCFATHPFGF